MAESPSQGVVTLAYEARKPKIHFNGWSLPWTVSLYGLGLIYTLISCPTDSGIYKMDGPD